MKLEGIRNGSVIATSGRGVFTGGASGGFELMGKLPNPNAGFERLRFDVKTGGWSAKLRRLVTGRIHSVNVWSLERDVILANATDNLFRSSDGGETWTSIKKLHPSSGIRGVLPRGLCYHDGTIYLGEYVFDESRSPRVFASDDLGDSWRTELALDGVRHVHAVQRDPYTGDVWIATGDRDSESKIARLVEGELEILGTGSQLWRAVELVFTPNYLLWGTDCPYQDNHMVRVSREEIGKDPAPEPLYTVDEPFYYSTSVEIDGESIALFSTGGSFSPDSTAPEQSGQTPLSQPEVGIHGASSASDFTAWTELATFDVKKRLLNRIGRDHLVANAYVFLEASPKLGVYVNPINTVTNDGMILHVDPDTLAANDLESAFHSI